MPQLSVVFDHHQIPTLTNKGFESLRKVKQSQLDDEGETVLQSGSQTAEYAAPKAEYCWKVDSVLDAYGNEDQNL